MIRGNPGLVLDSNVAAPFLPLFRGFGGAINQQVLGLQE